MYTTRSCTLLERTVRVPKPRTPHPDCQTLQPNLEPLRFRVYKGKPQNPNPRGPEPLRDVEIRGPTSFGCRGRRSQAPGRHRGRGQTWWASLKSIFIASAKIDLPDPCPLMEQSSVPVSAVSLAAGGLCAGRHGARPASGGLLLHDEYGWVSKLGLPFWVP